MRVLSGRESELLVYCSIQEGRLWNQEELSLNDFCNVYTYVTLGKLLIYLNLKCLIKHGQ